MVCLVILSLIACKNDKTVETEEILYKWIGKTIHFPDIEPIIPYSRASNSILKDSVSNNKNYKILFYIDSTGCTSCKLQLHIWKLYIEKFKSEVDFLFYFHPKNEKSLMTILRHSQFSHPVYIDNENKLNKLNNLPDNPQYQCFLINSNNEVISIGNPVNNIRIEELYEQIISGEISAKLPITTIETEQTVVELKNMKPGRTSIATFVLKNTGTQPLIIRNVDTSCGCSVPDWEKQPIAIGKSTKIKVQIIPEEKGYFNKTAIVHCNNEQGEIVLLVNGMVNE
jgi:hypothetical protein